jgi:hypothetical protein
MPRINLFVFIFEQCLQLFMPGLFLHLVNNLNIYIYI